MRFQTMLNSNNALPPGIAYCDAYHAAAIEQIVVDSSPAANISALEALLARAMLAFSVNKTKKGTTAIN
jgi:hypothetical protein